MKPDAQPAGATRRHICNGCYCRHGRLNVGPCGAQQGACPLIFCKCTDHPLHIQKNGLPSSTSSSPPKLAAPKPKVVPLSRSALAVTFSECYNRLFFVHREGMSAKLDTTETYCFEDRGTDTFSGGKSCVMSVCKTWC